MGEWLIHAIRDSHVFFVLFSLGRWTFLWFFFSWISSYSRFIIGLFMDKFVEKLEKNSLKNSDKSWWLQPNEPSAIPTN